MIQGMHMRWIARRDSQFSYFNIAKLTKYLDNGVDEELILEPCPIPTSKKEEIEKIMDSRVGRSTKNR